MSIAENMSIPFLAEDRHIACAAIATPLATFAKMITARIFRAVNADVARDFVADRTVERTYFHFKIRFTCAALSWPEPVLC